MLFLGELTRARIDLCVRLRPVEFVNRGEQGRREQAVITATGNFGTGNFVFLGSRHAKNCGS